MDRRNNPYAPGAGLQPPELAGRDRLLADAKIDMDRLLGKRPIKGMMLLGLRGVGKTVLLNRLHGIAEEKGIRTGKIEAPEGGALPQLLVPELRRILYALDLQAAAGHHLRRAAGALRNFVGAFKVKAGDFEFGIEPSPGRADTGNLEQDLPDVITSVAEAAQQRNSAIALLVDEVQYLTRLDSNFFRVRFDRLTSLQQKYLRAMAELGPGPHKTGDIASALGVETPGISNVRQQLIDKGMIWSQRYGETAFTVPMFDTFMRRQMPTLEKHEPKRRHRRRPRKSGNERGQ
jgi:hypothetical protein